MQQDERGILCECECPFYILVSQISDDSYHLKLSLAIEIIFEALAPSWGSSNL